MTNEGKLSLLHVSPTREDHGGIQSTLRRHLTRDAELGFAPRFLSFLDREARWPGECASLAAHGWMPVRRVVGRFAQAAAGWPASTVIYHDGWGIEGTAPVDRARRRMVYLHTERPHADELLRIFGPRVDGFFSVSHSFADRARRVLPDFPAERICVLPFFIEPPAWIRDAPNRGRASGPLRIGYSGRIERGAKRLDRLPALLAALDEAKVDFRFELLGDGTFLPELRRQVSDPRVTFLGWRSGEDYWRTIAAWDVVLLLSDYEGFSRAVMEAMSCGTIPVHPDFAAAAGELLGPATSIGLYPTGDVAAAARCVAAIAGLSDDSLRPLRRACAAHLAGHTAARYDEAYAAFLHRIEALPARAQAPAPPPWITALPLGVVTRMFPRRF